MREVHTEDQCYIQGKKNIVVVKIEKTMSQLTAKEKIKNNNTNKERHK